MAESIRIAGIMRESIVDGPGIRFAVFCQGCPHDCPGCHNPETHDFAGGTEVSVERLLEEFDKNPLLAGATFSGGEPMCQPEGFAALGRGIKERGKTITIYSGYTLEQLLRMALKDQNIEELLRMCDLLALKDKNIEELLRMCDLLIDGPFVQAKRDLTLQFRGSANQRLIDMPKTWKAGHIVLWNEA